MCVFKKWKAVMTPLGIAMIFLASGCGAKGKLYLPEEQQQKKSQPEASTSMEPAAAEKTPSQTELKKDKGFNHPDE